MDKIAKINDDLVNGILNLETIFRNAGLEEHAIAIRIALKNAEEDIVKEQNYGTDTIYEGLNSIKNINKSISNLLDEEDASINDLINLLNNHIDDLNNIENLDYSPSFVKRNNIPIIKIIRSIIEYIKDEDPSQVLDKIVKEYLEKLKSLTGED